MKANFKKVDGTVVDNIQDYVKEYKEMYPNCNVIVGTDSQEKMKFGKFHVNYVTCVCLNNGMRGGYHILSSRTYEKNNKKKSLFERLWHEVELSAEISKLMAEIDVMPEVHLDVNPSENHGSNIVYQAAKGYITSLGFEVKCKPDSPVATHAADHAVRGQNTY